MSYRARVFGVLFLAVVVPLGLLFWGVRREMTVRLSDAYHAREQALARVIRSDLAGRSETIGRRLRAASADLADDNRFRLAASGSSEGDQRWLIDWAGGAMALAGLDALVLQDSAGRILSSGQLRNEYDRLDPTLPATAGSAPDGLSLARLRGAETSRLSLVRIDTLMLGTRRFTLVGGTALDSAALGAIAPDSSLRIDLLLPDAAPLADSASAVQSALTLPFIDDAAGSAADSARIIIARVGDPLTDLRRGVDRWFVLAGAVTLALALLLAAALSAGVTRPLTDLARRTAAIDLDRLDQDFSTDRNDEIGRLSQLLAAMTDRLRTGAARLREAERRATVGDVARQVNHDIKNGLAPIRHVLRHLGQVARDEPSRLAEVYGEREGTLESSVTYLEELARNYARLSPKLDRERCDLNAIAAQAARGAEPRGAQIEAKLAPELPRVQADPVVLRRIIENLIGNAIDALDGGAGVVLVETEPCGRPGEPMVRITVSDTGRGMSQDELEHAFDDFYTTKPGGTGLGLSVVRRLVGDLGGALRVHTEPGAGTRFEIDLPAARGV